MTRKEKAEAKKNKRQEPTVQPAAPVKIDNTRADLSLQEDRAKIALASAAQPKIEAVAAMPTAQATVQNAKGLSPDAGAVAPAPAAPSMPTAQAFVQNEKGLSPNAGIPVEKPKTIADLIAEGYKKVEKEKTDAAKMQKYYALSDAFSALGRMGGAAVGGAIGGDMLGGAPVVPEYKESRGYIDAFERAKKANDRIKELDNMSYQLALKDEDRKYDASVKTAEREYKSQQDALNKDFELKMVAYKSELQQAIADKDFERTAQLQKQIQDDKQAHEIVLQNLKNAHEEKLKGLSLDIVKLQMGKDGNEKKDNTILFDNGTKLDLTKTEYDNIKYNLIGKKIGDKTVTKDNVTLVMQENPELINQMYNRLNPAQSNVRSDFYMSKDENGKWKFPAHMSLIPEEYMTSVETAPAATTKTGAVDYSAYKRK